MRRQRELHQDPVDARIRVEPTDERLEIALRRLGRQPVHLARNPHLRRSLLLVAHVDVRRGVVPDEHDLEAGRSPSLSRERRRALLHLGSNLRRDGLPIDDLRRHSDPPSRTAGTGQRWAAGVLERPPHGGFRERLPQVSFCELDARWLAHWESQRIFEKSIEQREGAPPFVFYEGPPTANGMPHPGHVLTRVMKDVFLRYKSMCGYRVPRRAGWDTHGLPVEVEVEKELGIHGRDAIEAYGVEAFTRRCIESVFRYIDAWREMSRRVAFWIDFDEAYVTFHKQYVESVWWALRSLFDAGLLYQDYKIVWWWPQGGTALSSGEVGQGYKEVDDPSVVVRFGVEGRERTSFLAWTTTPWTLSSNIALAVHPEQTYVFAKLEDGETVVLAKALVGKLLADRPHEVLEEKKGSELAGLRYEPPFRYAEPEGGPAYVVVSAEFVTVDTGSGMVHVAPAFGEDDFKLSKERGLGFLQLVRPDGTFDERVTDFAGRFCKEADRDIIRNLRQRGLLFAEEIYRHDYPFCWRAMDDPLIQYARRSWFIRTTSEIDRIIANNDRIRWEPEHIKDGRMGAFLRTNVDWALSRERYWGTPLPIWVNDETGRAEAVGSVAEILEKNPAAFDHFEAARAKDPTISEHLVVHKPWIDAVTWARDGEPGVYRKVPEVIDCWFDSGAMPFAQWGYPHVNREKLAEHFPADFITEAVDQTRGWFYTLMTISTLLFRDAAYPHPFRNCVVLGLITDAKGKKMSKRDRNYADPMELIATHGADAVRWSLYTGTVPGGSTRFYDEAPVESLREFLLKVWNVYSFFVTYANIDGFTPATPRPDAKDRPDLDRWILAELDSTVRDVRDALDSYRSHVAARRLGALAEALSNWYVRRSRARFWAEGNEPDKRSAFGTLYEVLVDFAKLLAPFTPFLAESLYQNLVRGADATAPESVHLVSFPNPCEARRDDTLRTQIGAVREAVALGQRVRSDHKIKVRQPLARAIAVAATPEERTGIERFGDDIREELNVRELELTDDPERYVHINLVPNFRALGPKLGKRMPACKKALGSVDGARVKAELDAHGVYALAMPDGEAIEIGPLEIEVRLEAREGYAAAASGSHVLVLDTRVTDDLRREGYAREVVNRIQRRRKDLDLPFDARIRVRYRAEPELAKAIAEQHGYIAAQTLAVALEPGEPAEGSVQQTDVEGSPFAFSIEIAEG